MRVLIQGVGASTLDQTMFVARGGQGAVYARDGLAFKIYDEPSQAPCGAKMSELALIDDPMVLTPDQLLLDPFSHDRVGYTMRFIAGASSFGQLMSRAFRDRHGIEPADELHLLEQLRQRVSSVHRAGALVVDLNEMNFIVPPGFDDVYAIDTDSYQTKRFAAVAIAPTITDPTSRHNGFSVATDWFSFAVLAFQMLVGIHPYKGRHPSISGLQARMASGVSVLDPAVVIPTHCRALKSLPENYRSFFNAVFVKRQRPTPGSFEQATFALQGVLLRDQGRHPSVALRPYWSAKEPVRQLYASPHGLLARTTKSLYHNGKCIGPLPHPEAELLLTPGMLRPVAAWLNDDGSLALQAFEPLVRIQTDVVGRQLQVHRGQLFVRTDRRLLHVRLFDVGSAILAAPKACTQLTAHGSHMHPGVVVQQLLGRCYVSLLNEDGSAEQLPLAELDGHRVVDAKHERGVLMLSVHRQGRYDRLTYRINGSKRDLRIDTDIDTPSIDFVVLRKGVCVSRNDGDQLLVSSAEPGCTRRHVIDAPQLGATGSLACVNDDVLVARAECVLHMTMHEDRRIDHSECPSTTTRDRH